MEWLLRYSMCVSLVATSAWSQPFAGTWRGDVGSLSLAQQGERVTGTATVAGVSGTLRGTARGAQLRGTYVADGEDGTLVGVLQGEVLSVSFDDGLPMPFRRDGAARGPSAASPDVSPPARTPAPAASGAPAPKVSAATGAAFRAEADGWAMRAPAGWKSRAEGNRVLLGSDTEAGLLVASFRAGTTLEALQQAAEEGFEDSGLRLTPTGPAQALAVAGARALAVDLQSTAPDGTPLRVRAAGVVGGQGAVVVLGLTTPAKFSALRARVDEAAKSVTFFTPRVPAGSGLLRGMLCSHSGGSVASWSRRVSFDGRGNVSTGSEMVAGGRFGDGLGNDTGSWGATSSGGASGGTYAVRGDTVTVTLGGDTYTCAVSFRQGDGRITELQCDGRLYAAGLCD